MNRIAPLLIAAFLTLPAFHGTMAAAQTAASCSASRALGDIGDALTSGNDAKVLRAARAAEAALRICGKEHDSISAELIAADAYGDTGRPNERCTALRDAAKRSQKLGETARARAISSAFCARG